MQSPQLSKFSRKCGYNGFNILNPCNLCCKNVLTLTPSWQYGRNKTKSLIDAEV